jgi:hypothetical protein
MTWSEARLGWVVVFVDSYFSSTGVSMSFFCSWRLRSRDVRCYESTKLVHHASVHHATTPAAGRSTREHTVVTQPVIERFHQTWRVQRGPVIAGCSCASVAPRSQKYSSSLSSESPLLLLLLLLLSIVGRGRVSPLTNSDARHSERFPDVW